MPMVIKLYPPNLLLVNDKVAKLYDNSPIEANCSDCYVLDECHGALKTLDTAISRYLGIDTEDRSSRATLCSLVYNIDDYNLIWSNMKYYKFIKGKLSFYSIIKLCSTM